MYSIQLHYVNATLFPGSGARRTKGVLPRKSPGLLVFHVAEVFARHPEAQQPVRGRYE